MNMVSYNILLKNKENAALRWFGEEKLNELLDTVDEILSKLEEYNKEKRTVNYMLRTREYDIDNVDAEVAEETIKLSELKSELKDLIEENYDDLNAMLQENFLKKEFSAKLSAILEEYDEGLLEAL
jgi:2C-methyl-D-erythritol 2,4-cyclodiphosphate synthase